jgi:outer membrane protein assembly factor BamB
MAVFGRRLAFPVVLVLLANVALQPHAAMAAASADQAVSYLINPAHTDSVSGDALTPPLAKQWSRSDLGGTVSYPLIVGGRVFVTVQGPYGNTGSSPPKWIYALDENTGATLWSRSISGTYGFATAAYDNGTVFVLNYDGLLQGFDAATGTPGLSVQLTGQYGFDSPPTAANGIVYVLGAGYGGTLYAVSESSGGVIWTSPLLNTGSESAPTLSSSSVFVSQSCQIYAYSTAATNFGTSLWTKNYGCSGSSADTSALGPAGLYVRNVNLGTTGAIFDPASGSQTGSFSSSAPPSFSGGTTYVLNSSTLSAVDASGNTLWTFTGDGGLVTAPVVVNNDIYIGSKTGMLYAVDAGTGQSVWSENVGAAFTVSDPYSANMMSSPAAGEGHLVAPAGSILTAYTSATPDTTPPVITPTISGTAGTNGWYTSPTTLTWSVTDPQTGIAGSTGCGGVALNTDTAATTYTCSATNGQGLTASSSVTLKVDVTAPTVSCGTPPTAWSASNISIACTAADATSGISPSDASFSLATSVAAGTETSSAGTPSRTVCDLAGNCSTAGPFTGLKVDKKAPVISLTSPGATSYTLNQSVAAAYSCTDGGSGVATCAGSVASGASIDTHAVGSKSFTVSAADAVGNTTPPASASYSVSYGVCQSQIPQIKAGHTGTVTVNLCDASGATVSSAAITVTAAGVYSSATGTKVQSLTNNFSYKQNNGYTESGSTTGLAGGSYYVAFTATGDPVTHQAQFTVK